MDLVIFKPDKLVESTGILVRKFNADNVAGGDKITQIKGLYRIASLNVRGFVAGCNGIIIVIGSAPVQ